MKSKKTEIQELRAKAFPRIKLKRSLTPAEIARLHAILYTLIDLAADYSGLADPSKAEDHFGAALAILEEPPK